ncbi:MAG: translation initiation factor [Porphyromonas sp.]|nr:translation initiation factor [Bacteroidales bacterium]MDY3101256.1 translation initiation factor [Porphyromonas sp.]
MSKRNEGGGLVFSTNRSYFSDLLKESLGSAETLAPEAQNLVVRRDTARRRGKVVTLIEGFEGKDNDLRALGKKIKEALGTGGSAKEGEIIIQGDLVDQVGSLLIEWGYRKTKIRR